jgi:hypothetical protein
MKVTRMFSTLLVGTLFAAAGLAAQHTGGTQNPKPPTSHRPATAGRTAMAHPMSFKGIAAKLGTTSEALESAYQTALAANSKLTRGQFIAANVLAHNLAEKYPTITTQAILDGLKSGKSIGQTLQSYGLSSKDAHDAQRAADREIRESEKTDSTK